MQVRYWNFSTWPNPPVDIDMPDGATVGDLLSRVGFTGPDEEYIFFVRNGDDTRQVDKDSVLLDGSRVCISSAKIRSFQPHILDITIDESNIPDGGTIADVAKMATGHLLPLGYVVWLCREGKVYIAGSGKHEAIPVFSSFPVRDGDKIVIQYETIRNPFA